MPSFPLPFCTFLFYTEKKHKTVATVRKLVIVSLFDCIFIRF